jgi:hypothetical protein
VLRYARTATADELFTEVTKRGHASFDAHRLPGHRSVAEVDDTPGEVVGLTALSPVSARECHAGVAESPPSTGIGRRSTTGTTGG